MTDQPTREELAEAHERLRLQLQDSLAQIEHHRTLNREKVRRYRAKKRAAREAGQ